MNKLALSLSKQIESFLYKTLTDNGKAAISAFLSLPGLENWNKENINGLEVDRIFNIGLPLALIGKIPSVSRHTKIIAKSICNGQDLDSSKLSELHVGALLSHWEMNPVFIEETNNRTPDLECRYDDGSIIDIEVVRADQRHEHVYLQERLLDFCSAIRPDDFPWNIACFLSDASNIDELNEVFDAVIDLSENKEVEKAGKWKAVTVSIDQHEEFLSKVKSYLPGWWPQNCPTYQTNSVRVGGSPTFSGYVTIISQIPKVDYINPIRRKAERPQNRQGHPYLIAMDSTELRRVHEWLPIELDGFFSQWDHVSGVLVFEPRFWALGSDKEYIWSIYPNLHACLQLERQLMSYANQLQSEKFSVAR
jgi:hypothetical protein